MSKKKPTLPNPFKSKGSLIAQAFALAQKGTTIDALLKFIEVRGGNGARMLRIFRRGERRVEGCTCKRCLNDTVKWRVEEKDGFIQVFYPA